MPKRDVTKDTPQPISVEPTREVLGFFRGVDPKKLGILILVVVAAFGMYGSWHFYGKYQAALKSPALEAQKEAEALVTALGKIIELPSDETPTIATISDKEKLKDQTFFKTALNGDKLFAYNTAMLAILYRPSTNKIINVAPIGINQPATIAPETEQSTSTPVDKKKSQ